MKASASVDMTEFNAAMKQLLATTSRTLPEFLNSRLFYLLLRIYIHLKPHSPQSERNRIRAYLTEPIGERRMDARTGKKVGRSRVFRRVHKIAVHREIMGGRSTPWKGKGRLAGADAMRAAAAKVMRQSIGSVGYLKSVVVKAIRKIPGNGKFTQFGRQSKKANGISIQGNAALIAMANQRGLPAENVSTHKGARAYVHPARDGFSPTAIADMAVSIVNGQEGRVASVYGEAFSRAIADETVEMQKHLAAKMQDLANDHMEKPL